MGSEKPFEVQFQRSELDRVWSMASNAKGPGAGVPSADVFRKALIEYARVLAWMSFDIFGADAVPDLELQRVRLDGDLVVVWMRRKPA